MALVAEAFTEAAQVDHRRRSSRRWYRNPSFVAGVAILGTIVAMALGAPLISKYDPAHQDLLNTLQGPGNGHLLGTDQNGRDVWSRLLYGARTDLRVAFLAVVLPFIIGTTLGLLAGYFGGKFDTGVNWLVNVVVAFPFLVLVIALVFVLGPGTRNIYIAITIVGWVSYARIIRGEVLSAKRREWVLAARAGGLSTPRILGRHVLPNVITQAVVFACSDIVLSILAIVTLGYFGLGVPPPTPDWGRMIYEGQTFLTTRWELATYPGIAVVITALGLALLADGLADLLRPRMTVPVLEVRDLEVELALGSDRVHPVRGASFDVLPGEALGLVGESGSGKTLALRAIVGLLPRVGSVTGGSILLDGEDLAAVGERRRRELRGSSISMVFQEPMTALNPVMRVGDQIAEIPRRRLGRSRAQAHDRALELMRLVGIPDPVRRRRAYPHELSGGLRQRVMIAIALSGDPRVILCDEPTTALDVTIQDQILKLLDSLRARLGVAIILVSHDLAVVAQTCRRVVVMYGGIVAETGPVETVFRNPRHPYTLSLLRSVPDYDLAHQTLAAIPGAPPDLASLPAGCPFHPRCPFAQDDCKSGEFPLRTLGPDRATACIHPESCESDVAREPVIASE